MPVSDENSAEYKPSKDDSDSDRTVVMEPNFQGTVIFLIILYFSVEKIVFLEIIKLNQN